ncbi:hypothetical protein PBY51_015751 [Eleginops maclovinus]|uniref:Ribonuclease A-domain domain-containing protein n=1 Tax=Eleginops maclovinus TaxID=56733 RepID=A0AAN7XQ29_ELEMC|nr:hypothetical protein PBY51_015751 [Eleginops maclovinus]
MRLSFACFLLLFATVSSVNGPYRNFINQHINGGMLENRCDQVIGSRGITVADSNRCKETNTFIRATTNHITRICVSAGEPYGVLTKSLQPFDIVICRLRNQGASRPHCQYRGQSRTRRIAIRCEGGLPVHYGGDIVYFDN